MNVVPVSNGYRNSYPRVRNRKRHHLCFSDLSPITVTGVGFDLFAGRADHAEAKVGQLHKKERELALAKRFPPVIGHSGKERSVLIGTAGVRPTLIPDHAANTVRPQRARRSRSDGILARDDQRVGSSCIHGRNRASHRPALSDTKATVWWPGVIVELAVQLRAALLLYGVLDDDVTAQVEQVHFHLSGQGVLSLVGEVNFVALAREPYDVDDDATGRAGDEPNHEAQEEVGRRAVAVSYTHLTLPTKA